MFNTETKTLKIVQISSQELNLSLEVFSGKPKKARESTTQRWESCLLPCSQILWDPLNYPPLYLVEP